MIDKQKLFQLWSGVTIKQKIGFISGVLVILLWLFLSPGLNKFRKRKVEIINTKGKIMQERLRFINGKKEIRNISKYEKQLKNFREELKVYENQLFSENEILDLISILTFKENSIDYLLFLTKEIKEDSWHRKLPIEINLESTYLFLAQYLEYIEKSGFFVSIDAIDIQKVKGTYNRINVKLKLTAYITE